VGIAVGDEERSMAHGTANLNTGQPLTQDTGFLLGSVTKVLTATIVMRLVERGEVDLDAPARRYVPEFALWSFAVRRDSPHSWLATAASAAPAIAGNRGPFGGQRRTN
jgi:CubicO group peptidase (beta-lactamase class C family)